MKIIRFAAENFLKLKAFDVTLDPDKNILILSGKNGQGKTSALSIITAAIGGAKLRPDKPIRDGEKSGFAEVEMDEYTARVNFKLREDGTVYETLTLKTKEGAKFSSAQSMLDKIIGDLSFDPLNFIRMDSKKQRDMLIEISDINFDFEKNAIERKNLYDERTDINRCLHSKEGELAGMKKPETEYLREEYSMSKSLEQFKDANENNSYRENINKYIEKCKDSECTAVSEILEREEEIKIKLGEIRIRKEFIKENQEDIAKHETLLNNKIFIDTSEIEFSINQSEEINKRIRQANLQKTNIELTEKFIEKLSKESIGKTHEIDKKDDDKRDALIRAKFPINGLSVDEIEVIWNDIPLKQTSSAEQLEISIAIAMAKNPKLPIILVTDGSLLDSEHMGIIERMAQKYGFDVLVEKVDESGKLGIVIEDGEIMKDNYKNPSKKNLPS